MRSKQDLFMDGVGIFNFATSEVPPMFDKLINKMNWKREEIDTVVFHQANKYMLNHIRKKIGIPEENFFMSMEHCGNTVSSTIPIALYDAIKLGKLDTIKNSRN